MPAYVAMLEPTPYLEHHGIKGQKWGVRRFQNPDGSLTPEGYRRYGKGTGKGLIGKHLSANTDARAKQGRNLGAKIGAGLGIGTGIVTTAMMAGTGAFPPAALVAIGASAIGGGAGGGAFEGAWRGYGIGAIAGAVETHNGRKYIHDRATMLNDTKAKDFVKSDYRTK